MSTPEEEPDLLANLKGYYKESITNSQWNELLFNCKYEKLSDIIYQ